MMAVGNGVAGVGLALLAGAAFEVSYVVQAVQARRVRPASAPRLGLLLRLARRPAWAGAILLSVAGFGLQVIALRNAPLTVVQPVLALGLVLLLVLCARVLREPVGRREWLAAAAVVTGVTLLVLAMPSRGPAAHPTGLAIACSTLGCVALVPFALRSTAVGALVPAATAGDALAALAINEVARTTTDHPGVATAAWAVLAAAAGLLALTAEATALQRNAAAVVAPIVLAGQVAIPVILAPLVAGERWGATPLHGGVIALGLITVVAATALLARSPAIARVRQAA